LKKLLMVLSIPLFVLGLVPAVSHADASVVQDSCIAVGTQPPYNVWTYFTVINFSLQAPVCAIHVVPEPLPVLPRCEIVDLHSPAGWTGQLHALGGADWTADSPGGCIPVGGAQGEFAFLLDPDYCCYVRAVHRTAGEILLEQEECSHARRSPPNRTRGDK